jgi:hypothetical protein
MTPIGAPRAKQLSNAATICGMTLFAVRVCAWGLYVVVGCSDGWPSYAPIVFLLQFVRSADPSCSSILLECSLCMVGYEVGRGVSSSISVEDT